MVPNAACEPRRDRYNRSFPARRIAAVTRVETASHRRQIVRQMTSEEFVERWRGSGGAELANSQSFLKELSDLLDVPQPKPTLVDASANTYVFDKAVEFNNGDGTISHGRVDLYRSGCFVLKSKQ